ncbi:MAG TPA: TadE/TadG family type IV pilus assembly protein [Actinomycetota bacterium]|nr:TadE/TadG family type IV pilus assembly protein [Actinomycetota bacterium]
MNRLSATTQFFRDRGQATVELALCLPLVAILLAVLLQVGVVVCDQTRLWHAAGEAARQAVVDPDPRQIAQAAKRSGLAPISLSVRPQPSYRSQGRPVTVALEYSPRSILPLLGPLVGGIRLHATATMRIEQP